MPKEAFDNLNSSKAFWFTSVKAFLMKYRRILVVFAHLFFVSLSYYLSFLIRFDGVIPTIQFELFKSTLPILLLIQGFFFIPFRMYRGLWRYTGIWDLRNIIAGAVSSISLFFLLEGILLKKIPWSIVTLHTFILIFFLGGIRLMRRIRRELGGAGESKKKILIFGAGDAGEMIVRDMKNNRFYNYEPVGFVDDDLSKVGQSIHGVRVLGSRKNLKTILESESPDEILIAMPKVGSSIIREVVCSLESFNLPIKTLPNLRDVIDGKVSINQIRNLQVEDLLDRAPVGLDSEPIENLIQGKRVMVTGAGGSIGSELCRQIASLKPKALLLFERHENSLYEIQNNLLDAGISSSILYPLVGDITDELRVRQVFEKYNPQLIFHAAAHKHVPLMEQNSCEAIKNNILGTQILAQAAADYQVDRFILISSDKAVNPSSVMGATKRIAEFLIEQTNQHSRTIFAAVRFGNVLGSNGSVVPRFLEQIKSGGPVTITHPEMKRYFMLIPEAVLLVLHAATLAKKGGEVFVLEMGEQIQLVNLAKNLIRLTGYVPEKEIPIQFIGLRPGEKLEEELIGSDEKVESSEVNFILRVKSSSATNSITLNKKIREILQYAIAGNDKLVIQLLCEMVPTYTPSDFHESPSINNLPPSPSIQAEFHPLSSQVIDEFIKEVVN